VAGDYPDKPIQLIMPYAAAVRPISWPGPWRRWHPSIPAAAGGDQQGRRRRDPRPTGSGEVQADGYTALFGWGSGEDLVVPHQRKLPYDAFNDFEVGPRLSIHAVIMTVPASSPHKDRGEFAAWAKTKEYVTASVSTKGAAVDITMQMFAVAAGFKMTSIPGSGSADALNKVLGGHVDCSGQLISDVLPHIKAGRLRVLAVALEQRDSPCRTCRPSGSKAYNVVTAGTVKGIAFPKGTRRRSWPTGTRNSKAVSEDPEFLRILKDLGQPANYMPSEEYRVWAKANFDTYGKLLKEFGLDTK